MLSDGYIVKACTVYGQAATEFQALSAKDRIWLAKGKSTSSGSTPVQPVWYMLTEEEVVGRLDNQSVLLQMSQTTLLAKGEKYEK